MVEHGVRGLEGKAKPQNMRQIIVCVLPCQAASSCGRKCLQSSGGGSRLGLERGCDGVTVVPAGGYEMAL